MAVPLADLELLFTMTRDAHDCAELMALALAPAFGLPGPITAGWLELVPV